MLYLLNTPLEVIYCYSSQTHLRLESTQLLPPPGKTFELAGHWYHDIFLTFNASFFLKVLHNDVMSHVRTMESLNQAGRGLLEVGSGDSPHGLQSRLEQLNENWEFVRCETERRQLELENRLSQVKQTKANSLIFVTAKLALTIHNYTVYLVK